MELIIRDLEERDIGALSIIESEAFSMPWSPKDFADLLSRDYCVYLVAELDGKVVGSAGMTDLCHEGNIDNVVVDAAHRGMGIGKKLMEALLKKGEDRGMEAYTLEVRVSNSAAIHVYEKAGFVSEGIRPGFYEKPVEDALIMWKRKNV